MSRAKEAAGRRAADFVESGMTIGLGTGSTVWFTLVELSERIRKQGLEVRGVPTSLDTERKARELGIPLIDLGDTPELQVTIDGADEVDPDFHLIKGGGGALLREKVVASVTRREIVVVGRDKLVERLGTTFLLPVEVVPFARTAVFRRLERLGATPTRRMREAGVAYRTDNGNEILDCRFPDGIPDPAATERALAAIPGVVESGLFVDLCHAVVIGADDGSVEVRER